MLVLKCDQKQNETPGTVISLTELSSFIRNHLTPNIRSCRENFDKDKFKCAVRLGYLYDYAARFK